MENRPTILIVDDDRVSLNLLAKLVTQLDYGVLMAADASEALNTLEQHPVDLVISDYEMPGANGLELLQKVKRDFPRLPFILVTAYSNLRVIREAWEHGAFDFFQKPVFVDRLNQTIRLAVEYGHVAIARRRFPRLEELQPDPDLLNIGVVRELAVALQRDDLLHIVEEYETHARIELEQILRYSVSKNPQQVRAIAHRLAGTSINLGLERVSREMRQIESHPEAPVSNPTELEHLLEKSIYWLKHYLAQIFSDLAV